jgi:hypothetical protein
LFERILAYSLKRNKQQLPLSSAKAPNVSVDLVMISVRPSGYLWRMQVVMYSLMLIFAFIALLPFFLVSLYWVLLWLVFALLIGFAIRNSWYAKNAAPVSVEIQKNNWQLTSSAGVNSVSVSGDVLLWAWVIVIPLRENLSGKQYYIMALPDSLDKEDWRRLRVWLMTCL